MTTTSIGEIGNYYGSLEVKEDNGKFYWGIDNYDEMRWEEIPEELYTALLKYEQARKEKQK